MNIVHKRYDNDPSTAQLNPTQQDTLAMLGATIADRPEFSPTIGRELERQLTVELADIAARLEVSKPLSVTKYPLAQVLSCERRFAGESSAPFSWSAPLAKGSVAHKAIELLIHRKKVSPPLDLVDDAIESLMITESGLADWLTTCSQRERDEVRALASEFVTSFKETFPPIKSEWNPVTESRFRVDLHGGRIILSGRTDLSLGSPKGSVAGKVLIDFKTGKRSRSHVDDLRFYALIETIRLGTPPRLLASYYLDAGRAETEEVTDGLLEAALVRTVDGAKRLFELTRDGRDPIPSPGPGCHWCSVADSCPEGTRFLSSLEEQGMN